MDLFFKIPFWGFQWKFTFHIFVEFRQRAALNYNYIAEIWHKIALETVHDSNSDLSLPQLTWQSYLCQVTQGSQAKLSSLACGFLVHFASTALEVNVKKELEIIKKLIYGGNSEKLLEWLIFKMFQPRK